MRPALWETLEVTVSEQLSSMTKFCTIAPGPRYPKMPKWRPSTVSASVSTRFLILWALPSNLPVNALPSIATGFQLAHGAVTCPTGVHSVTPSKSMSQRRLIQPSSFSHSAVDSPALTAAAKAMKSSADLMPGPSGMIGSTGPTGSSPPPGSVGTCSCLHPAMVRAARAESISKIFFI